MSSPLISVIIPCYKQAHFLPDAIASVQAQSHADWEIIVVDDGSPDDTSHVARAIGALDGRVRLERKQNGGLSSARNAGLRLARGRFIQFLDADDLIADRKFSNDLAQVDRIEKPCLVLCDYAFLSETGETIQPRLSQPKFRGDDAELELAVRWETDLSIPIHCGLFDARLFSNNDEPFKQELPNHEDFLMWLEVLARRPVVRYTRSCDALYRLHPAGMTKNTSAMYEGFCEAIELRISAESVRADVKRALHAKRAVVDNCYGYGTRARVRKFLEYAERKRLVPWKVYCTLLRIGRIEIREQQAALSRSFGFG